ncbi:MAG TPA: CHAT domain-containing protein [Pseudolabrys sp.]|nr:CHAT domain-containing protein [Pseudolabrys sp.]
MRDLGKLLFIGLMLGVALAGTRDASALTKEEAIENCRATVGRPIVQACMQGGRGDSREACRAQATPKVRECVIAALNKANGRANVPVDVPKEQAPSAAIAEQAQALPTVFIAPPRTIADITAILDSEKPDPARIAKLHADAEASVPANTSRAEQAKFYYQRGNARSQLGNLAEAIADADRAVEAGRGAVDSNQLGRYEQFAGIQFIFAGEPKRALEVFQRQLRDTNAPGSRGFMFGAQRQISDILIKMGDLAQAETYLQRNIALINEARTSGLPGWRSSYAVRGQSWEADVELNRAIIFEARGQYAAAEKSYQLAEQRRRASVKGILSSPNPPPESQILQSADVMVVGQSRMKAKQGRLAEAEADARRALLARLKDQGKYNAATPFYINGLANCLVEQGRYAEAEKLVRVALEIYRTVGVAGDSQSLVNELSYLASILSLQGKRQETADAYVEIDRATAKWDPQRRQLLDLNGSRIYSLYGSGQIDRGIAAAQELLKRNTARYGDKSYDTVLARGTLAVGYMRANRDAEAVREFRAAIPGLMAASQENADDDNSATVAARNDRLRSVVEAYISVLEHGQADKRDGDIAAETFSLADAIRGQSVQRALAQSSARMLIQDKTLADLVRQEQDLTKQINAQLGTLNNVLALPSGQRDENAIKALNLAISKLRSGREILRADVAKKFPSYANLIDPKPPAVDDIRATLKPGEALISYYFGRNSSFVWAVPKEGKVAFATIPTTFGEIGLKIQQLRKALEPDAALVSDIPPFDLALGYELYGLLLKPVEDGWKPAKSLIVVTNGALGQLPLSLLPVAPAQASDGDGPLFAGYRNVPWLARTHAVTFVPSASALRTLRQLPAGPATRDAFIGFGDPYFNAEQAAAAAAEQDAKPFVVASADATTTRGVRLARRSSPQMEGVDSADLAKLPRLPDTAAELISVAKALGLDPAKVLYLGKAANEHTVKSTDLSHYRIIDFATHGLVPGELDGLTQPALALTAPAVTETEGDGLLTMGEILALKLNADWVVLSACNTGAGAGAGAEAASGLGQAFFYAGTRAILVTNWSVHSASARELVTDLFRRQATDPALSRGEALRQASMALLDGEGFTDPSSKTVFAYAHPLFWAPYSIIGDGGGARP